MTGGAAGPGQADRGAAAQPGPDRPRSRRPLRLAVITLIVVALVGGGTASALVLTSHHDTSQAAGRPTPSTASTASVAPSTAPAAPSTIPATPVTIQATPDTVAPSPTASVPAAGSGQVNVVASAAGDPQTPQVLDFLDSYFAAINSHSYQGYRALVNPAEAGALTYAGFQAGYASTRDSAETLLGISTAFNGETVAKMAFTSHQNAANSVDGSQTCTHWRVLLYLEPNGSGYLLGKSPPGYHSSHEAC